MTLRSVELAAPPAVMRPDVPRSTIAAERLAPRCPNGGLSRHLAVCCKRCAVRLVATSPAKFDAYPEYTGETVATVAGKNVLTGTAQKAAQMVAGTRT